MSPTIAVAVIDLFWYLLVFISLRTQTMFVGVVALRYQHHTIDNGVPQLPQT